MLADFAQYSARISDSYNIIGDIFCDYAACAYDCIFAYFYARNNYNPCTNPSVFTDMNIFVILERSAP